MVKSIIIAIQFAVILALCWLLFFNNTKKQENNNLQTIETQTLKAEDSLVSPYKNSNISFEIIKAEGNTWGYQIFLEGTPIITQANKPGLPGNQGFNNKNQAIIVAELVIEKIRRGQMPPTVSVEELKGLGVL
jgi:hypothetical protein